MVLKEEKGTPAYLEKRKHLKLEKLEKFAPKRLKWIQWHRYFYDFISNLAGQLIEKNKKVLMIGSDIGLTLYKIMSSYGMGLDQSHNMVKISGALYRDLHFKVSDFENFKEITEKFDYIVFNHGVGTIVDIQITLQQLPPLLKRSGRLIIFNYSYFWNPLYIIAEKLRLKAPSLFEN